MIKLERKPVHHLYAHDQARIEESSVMERLSWKGNSKYGDVMLKTNKKEIRVRS